MSTGHSPRITALARAENEVQKMKKYVAHEQIGYYCHDTVVFVTERVQYHEYSQCGWVKTRNDKTGVETWNFKSYSSDIFRMNYKLFNDGTKVLTFEPGADYSDNSAAINFSRTTARQVSWALNEIQRAFNLSYNDISEIRNSLKNGNMHTII